MHEYQLAIEQMELAIVAAQSSSVGSHAEDQLRHALKVTLSRVLSNAEIEHASLEEGLKTASTDKRARRVAAIVLLRALAVPSVVPHSCEWCAIALFEQGLPDLWKHLDYDPELQTFEKWKILTAIHDSVERELVEHLKARGSLHEIEARKQSILKALASKLLIGYCAPFGYEGIRAEIQTIFGLLAECLKADDATLGNVIGAARRHLTEFTDRHRSARGFLVDRYRDFLVEVSRSLDAYDQESSSRFAAEIVSRMGTSELADKRYPLLETGRTIIVTAPFENLGPGTALDVVAKVSVDTDLAATNDIIRYGDVVPGGFSLSFPVLTIVGASELDVLVELSWATRAQPERLTLHASLRLSSQDPNVDWIALSKTDCYSTEVAEGHEFVGRKEKVAALLNRLSTARMQSTYITGQKRIGKTSLTLAVRDALEAEADYSNYKVLYLEWGDYARMDAGETVVALGTEIAAFLSQGLPEAVVPRSTDFRGTLAPLVRLSKVLAAERPRERYVVMLDEFDEIHPDMYRYGPLAEAVFSNLRTLSSQRNVAFILVGGERMPFVISAQGDQLNKFVRDAVDFFNRNEEWTDYQELVEGPTKNSLRWRPGAVNRIFELTNGHPYYTKLICSKVLRNAVVDRDSDITRFEVEKATHAVVGGLDTNAFAHYWKDGIQADKEEEETISLMRQRVLAGLARTVREGAVPTLEAISGHARSFGIAVHEVQPVLHEFSRRGILKESAGVYICAVPLFGQWLAEVGASRLVVDTFGDQLADALRRAEEEAYVRADELVLLTANWDTYRGRRIGADDVRAWLEQVSTKRDQRLLFRILQGTKFVSETDIRRMLKLAYSMFSEHVKPLVKARKSDRRSDILVVYIDGEGKSGQYYASKFAEENDIAVQCVMSAERFAEKAAAYETQASITVDAVVVVDDILGTGKSLSDNLVEFASQSAEFMGQRNAMLGVVALVASAKGEQRVRKTIASFPFQADLRVCEILGPQHFAFSDEGGLWKDSSDRERAKALSVEIGTRVYKKQPLGFGDEGLLVVFPVTCPNNSLPLLHSGSKTAHAWRPLFPRPVN